MRCSIALFAFIASFVTAAAGFAQADAPKGLFLVTDYPAQTVRAGEIATIRVKLTNAGLPPEPVALSLAGVPWQARMPWSALAEVGSVASQWRGSTSSCE